MHLKEFKSFLDLAEEKQTSCTSRATNEQLQYWAPLITYKSNHTNAITTVEHQKTVNIEKNLENGMFGFQKKSKSSFISNCEKKLKDAETIEVKLGCNDKSHQPILLNPIANN